MELELTALFISIVAIVVSITTFIKKQKSEEFCVALDIHSKLEMVVNELIRVYSDEVQKRSKSLEYLNVWEWFAFLVNNKEIKNCNIKKYFKPSLTIEVEKIFQDYPEVAKDDGAFKETKQLLEKWKNH
jgi:hypothetical protein